MKRTTSVGAGLAMLAAFAAVAGAPLGAQQSSVEAHANFARTTQTHLSSWGGGTQYQLLFGGTQQPVQLGSSLGVDYQKQEKGGPSETSGALDVTAQPGGDSPVTPYVGGSVSENWLSGGGAPSGAKLGLEYIIGAQVKLEPKGPLSLHAEVRPGYVRTQEHSISYRLGVAMSI